MDNQYNLQGDMAMEMTSNRGRVSHASEAVGPIEVAKELIKDCMATVIRSRLLLSVKIDALVGAQPEGPDAPKCSPPADSLLSLLEELRAEIRRLDQEVFRLSQ